MRAVFFIRNAARDKGGRMESKDVAVVEFYLFPEEGVKKSEYRKKLQAKK